MSTFLLNRDLIFLDVETTGLHVIRDRILQLAMIKYPKDGSDPIEYNQIINPGIPISEEAYQIHKIGPKEVANKPTFKDLAKELYDFIGNADLAGYNSHRFDFPMLAEEFARYGYDLEMHNRRLIDVQRIFYKMEPRTLKAAYQFYCGKDLVNAHDALIDIRATVDVLKGQLERYRDADYLDEEGTVQTNPVKNDVQALHDFTNDLKTPDITQRLRFGDQGELVFNFGKYINKSFSEVWRQEPNYFNWILEKEFSYQVKNFVRQYIKQQKESKS